MAQARRWLLERMRRGGIAGQRQRADASDLAAGVCNCSAADSDRSAGHFATTLALWCAPGTSAGACRRSLGRNVGPVSVAADLEIAGPAISRPWAMDLPTIFIGVAPSSAEGHRHRFEDDDRAGGAGIEVAKRRVRRAAPRVLWRRPSSRSKPRRRRPPPGCPATFLRRSPSGGLRRRPRPPPESRRRASSCRRAVLCRALSRPSAMPLISAACASGCRRPSRRRSLARRGGSRSHTVARSKRRRN